MQAGVSPLSAWPWCLMWLSLELGEGREREGHWDLYNSMCYSGLLIEDLLCTRPGPTGVLQNGMLLSFLLVGLLGRALEVYEQRCNINTNN